MTAPRGLLFAGVVLLLAASGVRADGGDYDCAFEAYSGNDGYWFADGSEEENSILTDIAQSMACRETAQSVEVAFPAPEPVRASDACPIADGATDVSDDDLEEAHAIGTCFVPFAFAVGRRRAHRFTSFLESELAASDWQRALAAAIALRDLGDENAAAWNVAARHWYPPVRLIGAQALAGEADRDDLQPTVAPASWRLRAVAESYAADYCEAQAKSWQGKWVENEPGLAEQRAFALEPLERVQGWPVSLPINTRRRFAGGLLVSTSMGEWGGAVYFFRAPELPRLLLDDVVHATRVSGDVAMVYAGIAHMGVSYSTLYRIALDGSGTPQPAQVLAQLPEEGWKVDWQDDLSALVIGDSGLVYRVGAAGAPIEVLGCVKRAGVGYRGRSPWRPMQDPFPN